MDNLTATAALPPTDNTIPPLPDYTSTPLPPIILTIPDAYLALALPIIAYWVVSLFFHLIDTYDLFPSYRLHTPAELLKRNHVSRWEVFRDVILQQVVQTFVGMLLTLTEEDAIVGKQDYDIAIWAQRIRIAQRAVPTVLALVGLDAQGLAKNVADSSSSLVGVLMGGQYPWLTQTYMQNGIQMSAPAFADWEMLAAKAIYWVGIPALQFLCAILIVDTWQYFWHRGMHMNKWLYTTFHSRHHRLYVPYAYGALYNHPVEGFLLDTLGAGIAYLVTCMTTRQSMWFFTLSTIKTVDDHCGYALPWDPLQHLTSNNAGYHDVHHQSWGIKTNFSQPFFTFWDRLLGTRWTGGDVSLRYERARTAAQKKVDADKKDTASSVTHTNPSESANADIRPYQDEKAVRLSDQLQQRLKPTVPAGKATLQALGSREQVLEDQQGGGVSVLVKETREEEKEEAQQSWLRRSPRKMAAQRSRAGSGASSLMGLRDRVNERLVGSCVTGPGKEQP
ncbi:MAG: hypothetical protein M1822_009247 [Bathelium mastoideum]|nr:MAG: hypothetical protein M1822_009247 [Bathelium mastoideum]